jgi:anti-anti-sigma factor
MEEDARLSRKGTVRRPGISPLLGADAMASDTPAHFQWDLVDGVAIVEILSRQINNPHLAQELGGQLKALFETGATKRFLLDFHKTSFMSSTAFATVLGFAKMVSEAGGRVRICSMHPHVRLGADFLRMGEVVPILDDCKTALAAFALEGTIG